MQTLIPGQRYRVRLLAYELAGEFDAVFLRVDDATGDDGAMAVWSNGVRLEMWGWDSDDESREYGWRVEPTEG